LKEDPAPRRHVEIFGSEIIAEAIEPHHHVSLPARRLLLSRDAVVMTQCRKLDMHVEVSGPMDRVMIDRGLVLIHLLLSQSPA
jgi:hypothetical protein